MADIITTLHKKGENTVNVYPNIKSENIPSASITQDKIANGSVGSNQLENSSVSTAKIASSAVSSAKILNGAVTTYKIADGAVTTDKLANGAVDNSKLASNAVSASNIVDGSVNTNKIADGTVTKIKLSNDLQTILTNLNKKYNFYFSNQTGSIEVYAGTFTASDIFESYSSAQIAHAFNFNRNQIDYTEDDLIILSEFINGIDVPDNNYDFLGISIESKSIGFIRYSQPCIINYNDSGSNLFTLEINTQTHAITSYTNTEYIQIKIKKFI